MTEMDEELMLRSIAEYKREMLQPVRTHQLHPLIQEKPLVLKAIKAPAPKKLRMPPQISTKVINAASQVFGVPVEQPASSALSTVTDPMSAAARARFP